MKTDFLTLILIVFVLMLSKQSQAQEIKTDFDQSVTLPVNTESEIDAHNTLEDVIGDISLPHEGLPHGASHFDWGKAPRAGAKNPPSGWTAAIAWGQLYEWIDGNQATNTRVQIRDLQMYYLSKTDNKWHELQKSLLVEGAAYREDFAGDINKPADIRKESDGSISVTTGKGFNFHFWPKPGRVLIPENDVAACFVTVQCRLIPDDPNGVDDLDSARYLMGVGGDWWKSMTAQWDNWTTNADMGIGRFRFVTKEWQGHNLITLSPEETLQNPPPLPKLTGIETTELISENDFEIINSYPNPFYDSTTIQYTLVRKFNVKLEIFNAEGKYISTLINEIQPAGVHKINFNGSTLKGGFYYYTLTTDDFVVKGKMLLVK